MEEIQFRTGYAGIDIGYPSGTTVPQEYPGGEVAAYSNYVLALPQPDLTLPDVLVPEHFQRYDGELVFAHGKLVGVRNIMLAPGGTAEFRDFRRGVSALSFPDGKAQVGLLPVGYARALYRMILAHLREHGVPEPEGELVAAGVLYEPNRFRPDGPSLFVPPPFQPEGEELAPLYAKGIPKYDRQVVRVMEMILDLLIDGRRRISARIGLGVNGPVVVDLHRQLTTLRADRPLELADPFYWLDLIMAGLD